MLTIERAQRKVEAIDKRIDAVRAAMWLAAGIDFDAFDVMTEEGGNAALTAATVTRRDFGAYDGIERDLYRRRGVATDLREDLIAKKERADKLRADREFRKQAAARRRVCGECGAIHYAA